MRKVLGADRLALVRQFLGEAVLTVGVAALLGLILAELSLPLVNAALDKIPQWSDFHTVVKRCRHTNNAGLIGAYYAFETEVEGMEKVPIR